MKTELNEKWVVCRVCLNNPNDGDDLFQEIFSQNASTRLDQMLHICAGIPVSADDNFPDKMCSKCVRVLRVAYKFRLTCQRSHQHIADLLATELDKSQGEGAGEGEDEESEAEAIARSWEMDAIQTNSQIKLEQDAEGASEEIVGYLVANDDADADTIVFDGTTTEDDQVAVYEDASVVELAEAEPEAEPETETETDNFAEYEDLEYLTSDSLPPTAPLNRRQQTGQRFIWSAEADDDMTNDILSSEDDSYMPEVNQEPRLQNRVRQPRKVQQRPKATGLTIDGVHEEKKMGRKPRDKHSNYICDVCGNIYPSQARLTEHMKFHSGVKPHECEICGRGFVQNQQLVRHMNTHTGNRPYKCNFCPAAFADRSTKTKHHRIHTKERPYECDVCLKTFTYSDNLKFHKMIHTGEKPHVCDLCGKGFVKAYKMRLHRVTHEKRGPWKPVGMEISQEERIKDEMSEIVIGALPTS